MKFAWRALDVQGKTVAGSHEAATAEEVGQWLLERDYHVLEIKAETLLGWSAGEGGKARYAIGTQQLNFFFLQLASLINAGCPLILSLQAMHRQLPPGDLKDLVQDIKEKIEMGKSFSEALRVNAEVFSNLFITMVEVGETGGVLGEVLERYAQIFDSMYRIQRRVITSMIYPVLLLTITLGVTWALLVFVFPTFIEQITSRGGVLPLPTRIVLFLSGLLVAHGVKLFLLAVAFFAGLWMMRRSDEGRRILDRLRLDLPILGPLFRHVQLALFTRTLGTLLKCQVPIMTSLKAVERTLDNQVFRDAMAEIRSGVARGESLSNGMGRHRGVFPDSLILMVDVGERGGNTGEMLDKAAVIYERDLETTISTAISLIEPLLVVFLSVFVVLVALAMYLPMFDIVRVVR